MESTLERHEILINQKIKEIFFLNGNEVAMLYARTNVDRVRVESPNSMSHPPLQP